MTIISEVNQSILSILKRFLKTENCTRWSRYCVQTPAEAGVLVYNLLTREMLLLTREEYANFTEISYLKENGFVVPENTREKEWADFVKWVLTTRRPKSKEITGYTIFTTTDCNARCFYCFELGGARIPMSCQTAEKVLQYILDHCGGKEVHLSWFGGEPLFNDKVIDIICEGLKKAGIAFRSKMTSNGYLFDDEIIRRAGELWNLKRVQITLDGTEQVYNKIKAYIYRDTNPYEIVMKNIGRLLDAGIYVSIRLNMDTHNAEDLLTLAEELARRFAGKKNLGVYAHHLFKTGTPNAELHTEEQWQKRELAMSRLNASLEKNGLLPRGGISKHIKLHHCMADSGRSVTVLPNGELGLCEHYTDSEFIGHIDREEFDARAVASWQERTPEIPECAECFYYLECIKLKKCSSSSVCYRQFREDKLQSTKRAMLATYDRWQQNAVSDEDEDDDDFDE